MKIEDITTEVRPRNKWQALDLGFRMASLWYWPLFISYIIISLPIALLANLLITDHYIYFASLLVWWLKPMWERIQLIFLSRALFGQILTFKQQFKLWLNAIKVQPIASLTYRRLSFNRSYHMPILLLENPTSAHYNQRVTIFDSENRRASFWLTFVLVHLETIITIAVITLISLLIPEHSNIELEHPLNSMNFDAQYNMLAYLSIALVAPFFVCGGFALYINQRTQIEGWDIELNFKRLVNRVQAQQKSPLATKTVQSVLIAMLVGALIIEPQTSFANTAEQKAEQSPEQLKAREQIETILQSEDFNQTKTQYIPEFLDNLEQKEKEQPEPSSFWDSLADVISFIASSIEWILTLLVIFLALILAFRYRHWLMQYLPADRRIQHKPSAKQLFGLDLPELDTLENVPNQALQLFNQHQQREALSLLYRASLQALVSEQHITVNDAFTEGQCLYQVKQNADEQTSGYFAKLTRNWQQLAYADRLPATEVIESLITQWSVIFVSPSNVQQQPEQGQPND